MQSAFQEIDIAFISLCLFFFFFACLVFYLRREDRREGYPLEEDDGAIQTLGAMVFVPAPKTFALAHGQGDRSSPNFDKRDSARSFAMTRVGATPGSPMEPMGDPMLAGVGPGAFAERPMTPDLDAHGEPRIVPMRTIPTFTIVDGDPDPRGMTVYGCDGNAAGTVSDLWIDKAESLIRYFEVSLRNPQGTTVLLPMTMSVVKAGRGLVAVNAITSTQFANVPKLSNPVQVTLDEEERICAYYGAGFLYATPERAEPLL